MKTEFIAKFKNMSENNKIVFNNVLGAFLVKGLALIVSLFTMPAYLRFFHDETVLGVWFTILSVLNWILNFDLGIGNGLRNNLAKTIAQKNDAETKKYLSSAYVSVGVLCISVSIVFAVVFNHINWNAVFNIDTSIVSRKALLAAVKIVFIGIILQLFFKLINSVLYALQKSSVNNFLVLCSSVITIILVSVMPSKSNDENIVVMAIVNISATIVPLIIATVAVFFGKTFKSCIPSIHQFSKKHAKDVLMLGGMFLFVQLMYLVVMSTNEYLINMFCTNDAVVDYHIYYKLFSLGSTVFTLALTPIWSAVTKALVEKNFDWIYILYKRLVLLAAVGTVLEFLLIPFLQIFINLWLGKSAITVNYTYGLAFAALGGLMMINSVLSSIANGIGKLKTQAVFFGIGAVIKIPLAFLLVKYTSSWIGVVWANVISIMLYCFAQPLWLNKYLNNKKEEAM